MLKFAFNQKHSSHYHIRSMGFMWFLRSTFVFISNLVGAAVAVCFFYCYFQDGYLKCVIYAIKRGNIHAFGLLIHCPFSFTFNFWYYIWIGNCFQIHLNVCAFIRLLSHRPHTIFGSNCIRIFILYYINLNAQRDTTLEWNWIHKPLINTYADDSVHFDPLFILYTSLFMSI